MKRRRKPASRHYIEREDGDRGFGPSPSALSTTSSPRSQAVSAAIEISVHTGMRQSEQYGLMRSQVDLDERLVFLPKTKNGKPRHIPLNAVAVAAFESIKTEGQEKGSPVFPNGAGEAMQGARGWFKDAVALAQLTDYTWHCNRHRFASRLVMAGVDLRTVGELPGHHTAQMTLRYAHLAPSRAANAVDRLVTA